MSRLSRITQKIFGSSAANNQIAQFGSLASGSPVLYPAGSADPSAIQSLANYLTGWFGAVVGGNSPAIEDMNALCFLYAYQLAYLMQSGIAEWDAGTTYYQGSLVQDGTGSVYTSIVDTNLNNPLTDGTKWAQTGPAAPNSLLNSDFYFNQRAGVSGTAIPFSSGQFVYTLDRWAGRNNLGAVGVVTVDQIAGTLSGSLTALRAKVTTAPTVAAPSCVSIYQTLDQLDSEPYFNGLGNFSVNVKALGNVNQVHIQFFYSTSPGSVLVGMTAIGSPVTVTVNSAGFTKCVIPAQAMGTAMTRSGVVGIGIIASGVSSGNLSDLGNGIVLEQAMMNPGPSLSAYRRALPSIASELQALKRYFEKSNYFADGVGDNLGDGPNEVWVAFSATVSTHQVKYQVEKRSSTNTVTLYNPGAVNANKVRDLTASSNLAAVVSNALQSGFQVKTSGSPTAGDLLAVEWTCESELF